MSQSERQPEPHFVICSCQHCDGYIEFDATRLDPAEKTTVPCPHCGIEAVISSPATERSPNISEEHAFSETGDGDIPPIQAKGSLGVFGFTDWWFGAFSEAERACITSRLPNHEANTLTVGTFTPDRAGGGYYEWHPDNPDDPWLGFHLGSWLEFLWKLLGGLNPVENYGLCVKITRKIIQEAENPSANIIDKHDAYGWMVGHFYDQRKFDPTAIQRTIWACLKQIQFAPQLALLIRPETGVSPSSGRQINTYHQGYRRLVALLERDKQFGGVMTLCKKAIDEGWQGCDWNAKFLKAEFYANGNSPDDGLPRLPELTWNDDLINQTKCDIAPIEAPQQSNVPPFELNFVNGVLKPMTAEQARFYRTLVDSIRTKEYVSVERHEAYLNFYIREKYQEFQADNIKQLHAELRQLMAPYGSFGRTAYWQPQVWSYDCLLELEAYEQFFEATKPANIFSTRSQLANLRCNVRFYLGMPASGIDFLQMHDVRITKFTKQHPQEFETIVETVFAEEERKDGSWLQRIFDGSDRVDYQINLFSTLHFAHRCAVPNYCFFRCSPHTEKQVKRAFREAENRLRQLFGERNVGERWDAETRLYNAVRDVFPDTEVIRHGKPEWLGKQHLDIWLPEFRIGIEYHGPQHFQPMGHLGGDEHLIIQRERDARKARLCDANGVTLIIATDETTTETTIARIKQLTNTQH